MHFTRQRVSFGLSLIFATMVAAVFLFLTIAMVPYWQAMTGAEVQTWFAGPFTRFSIIMVPTHVLSIVALAAAVVVHRKTALFPVLLFAFAALLVCQGFNFTLYGAVLNPALQSQELPPDEALATLDRWAFYHLIRTSAIFLCVVILFLATLKRAN
ncbi:MAG: hypothetical protein AAF729_00200 [Pseudomonadota bacterium]